MKLIVGLGNPGKKYQQTPHNLGYTVIELLAQEAGGTWKTFSQISHICRLTEPQVVLLKPQSFMNQSGLSVKEIKSYFKIRLEDVWLVHDELDLPTGKIRINFAASAAGHRGVQNVIDSLASKEFWRWRLGIGRPPAKMTPEDFVLTHATKETEKKLLKTITQTAVLLKFALSNSPAEAKLKNTEK